jgi:hypothetical protein
MSDPTQRDAAPPSRGPTGDGDHEAKPFPSPLPESARNESPERGDDRREPGTSTAAGPHSQPSLTNADATPGAGTLPDPATGGDGDIDTDAATG